MAVRFVLPISGQSINASKASNDMKKDVKDLVFSILAEEYPLKIIELTNFIRRRYGRSVTFQGVRKAIMQLVDDGVVIRTEKEFMINKEWVQNSKKILDKLYINLVEGKKKKYSKKFDSIGGDVSVFAFNSINEMVKVWEDLSDEWYKSFRKGEHEYNINCYQAAHSWEVLLHPDVEAKLMSQCKKKGIKAYILCTENTPLDRSLARFHDKIGVKVVINPSSSSFDKSHYIGTYGSLIIQAKYPQKIVKRLDEFFRKNQDIGNINLSELSEIANAKVKVKMTVIKNLEMAKQINSSIFSKMYL